MGNTNDTICVTCMCMCMCKCKCKCGVAQASSETRRELSMTRPDQCNGTDGWVLTVWFSWQRVVRQVAHEGLHHARIFG